MEEIRVKLDKEDYDKLERLHYEVNSRINLIKTIFIDDSMNYPEEKATKMVDEYTTRYIEYSKFKDYITAKYGVAEQVQGFNHWITDFNTQEVVFIK